MTETSRRTLLDSPTLQIGLFQVRPSDDACGQIERQTRHVVVLPLSGLFCKHDAPRRAEIGTPGHAVFIAAEVPYRISFPGAIGDRALTLRFDDELAPDRVARSRAPSVASSGLLSAEAMVLRNLLQARGDGGDADELELEAIGLELVRLSLTALRAVESRPRAATQARWRRALHRVREALAMCPSESWNVSRLAGIAGMSPYHLCRVFRQMEGVSVYEYVLHERMARTLDAVLDGDDLSSVALAAGFASHSHFTARFRDFFGCTPGNLRRRVRSGQANELRKIVTARRH